jgi:hypothetical protein
VSRALAIVGHHVADYDQWYPVFIEHGSVRRAHGATGHTIGRSADDTNFVVVVNVFGSVEGAQAFATDPSLPDVMHRAGVDGPPTVWIVSEAETATY